MELIKKWLFGSKNFLVGAILYKQFGQDESLKKLFTGKPDGYMQKRLEEALSALLQQPKVIRQQPAKSEAEEMPVSADAVLMAIRNEWTPIYQRMNYLRHELDRYEGNSPEEIAIRKPIAFEILELEQQCMKLWARRDHYLKHGQLPEVKEATIEIPKDPVELGRLIETLKRNIRRNKQAASTNPANTIYPLKIRQYEEQLQHILKNSTGHEGTK